MARHIMNSPSREETQALLNRGILSKPYVVFQEDEQIVDFDGLEVGDTGYWGQYLTVEIETDNENDHDFCIAARPGEGNYYLPDEQPVYYSVDGGEWLKLPTMSFQSMGIKKGQKVRLKGNIHFTENDNFRIGFTCFNWYSNYTYRVKMYGNVMSLIYGDDFFGNYDVPEYAFNNIFSQIYSPINDLDASNLIIPDVNVGSCKQMFWASPITKCPQLFATQLKSSCYLSMFRECQNLIESPEIPNAELAPRCYQEMFAYSPNLRTITCLQESLPVGKTIHDYFEFWTINVAGNGTFIKSSNAEFWERGWAGIPDGWIERNDNNGEVGRPDDDL